MAVVRGADRDYRQPGVNPAIASKREVAPQPNKVKSDSNDLLRLYLNDVKGHALLNREEEKNLAIRYQEKGDLDAGYQLITANLRLVIKIALKFQRHWMQNLMDLIQEGNVGLVLAARKFDPYRGYKFSYYASFWIKAYIIRFIMDNWKLVKIGTTQAQRKLFFNLSKEKARLEDQGIDPTPKRLSERLSVKESEVIEMDHRINNSEISLDAPVKMDSAETKESFIHADQADVDDQVANREANALLRQKLIKFGERLQARELIIFQKRMLAEDPLTLQKIGNEFGVSRERVRQIESHIKGKLKSYLESEIDDISDFHENLIAV